MKRSAICDHGHGLDVHVLHRGGCCFLVVSAEIVVEFGDVKPHSVRSGKTIAEHID